MRYILFFGIALVALSSGSVAQWSQLAGKDSHWCLAVYAIDDALIAATQDSNIMRSTDQGATWQHSSTGIQDSLYTNTLYGNGDSVYLGSNKGGYASVDGGQSWRKIDAGPSGSHNVFAYLFFDGYLFIGGDSGVFRSSDGGQTWQSMNSGLPLPVTIRAFGSNDRFLYTGTKQKSVFRSSDNGEHWERSGTGLNERATVTVLSVMGGHLFGTYDGAAYFQSFDYGDTWTAYSRRFTPAAAGGFCAVGIDSMLIVGTSSGVVRSIDDGETWIDLTIGMPGNATVLSLDTANGYLYAGTLNHWIWRRPLSEILPPAEVNEPKAPYALRLNQSTPNPTAFATEISYSLPNYTPVSLKLYNAMMQEVSTLVDEPQEAGEYHAALDVSRLPSGVYYYRLSTGISSLTRRMVIMK